MRAPYYTIRQHWWSHWVFCGGFDSDAASIDQAINGFPASSKIFLLGNPLLPPLAGITARTDLPLITVDLLPFDTQPIGQRQSRHHHQWEKHPPFYPVLWHLQSSG